jgi:hypothetical protein
MKLHPTTYSYVPPIVAPLVVLPPSAWSRMELDVFRWKPKMVAWIFDPRIIEWSLRSTGL